MSSISAYLPWFSVTAILTFLLLHFKIAIDSINMRPIEKVFFTNSKKVSIYFSILMSSALIVGFLLVLYLYFIERAPLIVADPALFSMAILSFSFVFLCFTFFLLLGIVNFFNVKPRFYIRENDDTEEWYIVKAVSNTKILLSSKSGTYKFITSETLMDKSIVEKIGIEKVIFFQNFIYKHKIIVSLILYITIILSTIFIFIFSDSELKWRILLFTSLVLEYLVAIYIFIAINNGKILDEAGKNINSKEGEKLTVKPTI